jgi:hypothetical protein
LELSKALPKTKDDFLAVPGITDDSWAKFGQLFLEITSETQTRISDFPQTKQTKATSKTARFFEPKTGQETFRKKIRTMPKF